MNNLNDSKKLPFISKDLVGSTLCIDKELLIKKKCIYYDKCMYSDTIKCQGCKHDLPRTSYFEAIDEEQEFTI